jgi:hypothetical protein
MVAVPTTTPMATSIKGNGWMVNSMVKEYIFTLRTLFIRGIGWRALSRDLGSSLLRRSSAIQEIGKKIKRMVAVHIYMPTVRNMKVHGRKIRKRDTDNINTRTAITIWEIGRMTVDKGWVP